MMLLSRTRSATPFLLSIVAAIFIFSFIIRQETRPPSALTSSSRPPPPPSPSPPWSAAPPDAEAVEEEEEREVADAALTLLGLLKDHVEELEEGEAQSGVLTQGILQSACIGMGQTHPTYAHTNTRSRS